MKKWGTDENIYGNTTIDYLKMKVFSREKAAVLISSHDVAPP